MAQLLVRDLNPRTVAKLKRRARESGRSLQGEVKKILDEAATQMTLSEFAARAEKIRRSLMGRPHSDSVALIREDRDR